MDGVPATTQLRSRRPRRRLWVWIALGLLLALGGGAWQAYEWLTNSDTLVRWIAEQAPKYFPGSEIRVHHVQFRPSEGSIHVRHLFLTQTIDEKEHTAFHAPWIGVNCDAGELLHGRFLPKDVSLIQPTIRLKERHDGTWNVQGLLADPWPARLQLKTFPLIKIQNGIIELADESDQVYSLLRDVNLKIQSDDTEKDSRELAFDGWARGDLFDSLRLEGTINRDTGAMTIKGNLRRLLLSEIFRQRLPDRWKATYDKIGLQSGELDLNVAQLQREPSKNWTWEGSAELRSASLNHESLPFPLSSLSVKAKIKNDAITIDEAIGYNGKTVAQGWGEISLNDPLNNKLDLNLDVIELELDERLKNKLPEEYRNAWNIWLGEQPASTTTENPSPKAANQGNSKGRVSLGAHLIKDGPGKTWKIGAKVQCLDVSVYYREFPYPLPHVSGILTLQGNHLDLDLNTTVGGKPAWLKGTVDRPGRMALSKIKMGAEALPIDKALMYALKPNIREVVEQFEPTGTVQGQIDLVRNPPPSLEIPHGPIDFNIVLDLKEQCALRWRGLPYPVNNLKGRLRISRDRWTFENMKGENAQASIEGDGTVWRTSPTDPLQMSMHIWTNNLAFDQQLRTALPPAWRKTWATLNPSGACDTDARIEIRPGARQDLFVIKPKPDTRVQLELPPLPNAEGRASQPIRLPAMEDVRGKFVFRNGVVTMTGVGFEFRGSPVVVESGQVRVEDSGAFLLTVRDLAITDFRIDSGLRKLMPPMMAQHAKRLNDESLPLARGDLEISWSGDPGELAQVAWSNGLIVFNGNSIQAGIPIAHLQGQIEQLRGKFNGREVNMKGMVNLESMSIQGVQFSKVKSPLHAGEGRAGLSQISAELLGGTLTGHIDGAMDATSKYSLQLGLANAQLEQYTMTIPGRQQLKGRVSGAIACTGHNQDRRTIQGQGWARIDRGDLGELPAFLSLIKFLKLSSRVDKTAFDSAQTVFRIKNGAALLDSIKLAGDAFSLEGAGRLDVQGDLDLRLQVLLGRDDQFRLPLITDLIREAGGQILMVHVQGTPQYPRFALEPLPQATNVMKSLSNRLLDNGNNPQQQQQPQRQQPRTRPQPPRTDPNTLPANLKPPPR